MKSTTTIQSGKGITIILGIVIFFLVSRFFFLFSGANPAIPFVDFVYQVSGIFLSPFQTTNSSAEISDTSVLDISPLFAAVIYAFLFQVIDAIVTTIYTYINQSKKEALSNTHQTPQQI